MKASLSLFVTSALLLGATSLAFGSPRANENSDQKAKHATTSHRSRNSHHHSTGSQRHNNTNSGSKTHSNIPSNGN